MSHTVVVKFAPVFTCDRFNNPAWTRPGRRMYYPGALKFLPGRSTVPLLADHDEGHEIGTVDKLFQMDWTDGPWICASATVPDAAASWIKRGARASFGSRPFDCREVSIRGTTAEVIADAFVDEVSVLIAMKPGEPLARVLWIDKREESPPAVPTSDRAAGGEVFYGDGRTITRHGVGRVLAVGGRPVPRTSAGQAIRREGHDYVIEQRDGTQSIYHGADAYAEALRDGAGGLR